jgi:hypothetical protein
MLPHAADRPRRSGRAYQLTAIDGPSPGRRAVTTDDQGGGAIVSLVGFSTAVDRPADGMHSIGPITMSGTTLAQFALTLEEFLDAPVIVDEGESRVLFDIELRGEYEDADALTAALREQLGLELTKSL